MATKLELLNAMKVINDHCIENGEWCKDCIVWEECMGHEPYTWEFEQLKQKIEETKK